jgi:hypothetical protein
MATVASLAFGLSASFILAQGLDSDDGGIKLSISPIPISLSAQPGQIISTQLEIRNSGSKTETLTPSLLTFSASGDSGQPRLNDPGVEDDYLRWVSFSPTQLTLKPLEWGKTIMTINVPSTAAYGYYFAVSWGRLQDKSSVTPAAASLIGSVAQLILLEVPAPGTKRQLAIDYFKSDSPWYEFLPADFSVRLKNTGNIHATPFGNIFISDDNHHQVGSLRVNTEKGVILPASSRLFRASWTEGFPAYQIKEANGKTVLDRDGKPQQQLTWNINHAEWWRFGHYHASLVMAYSRDGKDIPLLAQTDFWIIPWRLIALLIAIPTLPALLVYLIMRRMRGGHS